MAQEREIIARLENQPGNLAKIGNAMRERNVNIREILASEQKGKSPVHLLVDKVPEGMAALKDAGIEAEEKDILIVELDNRPGTLGEAAEKLQKEGINVDYAYYSTTEGQTRAAVILGVSDLSKAASILG
ncbi:MAG: hypothetical protein V3V49_13910 [Candidatus Krumholzibacteria bacterium]